MQTAIALLAQCESAMSSGYSPDGQRSDQDIVLDEEAHGTVHVDDHYYTYRLVSQESREKICKDNGLQFTDAHTDWPEAKTFGNREPPLDGKWEMGGEGECMFNTLSFVFTGAQDESIKFRHFAADGGALNPVALMNNADHGMTPEEYKDRLLAQNAQGERRWGTSLDLSNIARKLGIRIMVCGPDGEDPNSPHQWIEIVPAGVELAHNADEAVFIRNIDNQHWELVVSYDWKPQNTGS